MTDDVTAAEAVGNPSMKVIINAPVEDMPAVMALILENRTMFVRTPARLGWGWFLRIPNGNRYFLREIKGGVSANPENPATPTPSVGGGFGGADHG